MLKGDMYDFIIKRSFWNVVIDLWHCRNCAPNSVSLFYDSICINYHIHKRQIKMKIKLMISLVWILEIISWAALLYLTINSNLDLKWICYIDFFGGCTILIFGGWLCQNLAMSNKKRHATLVTKRGERYLRSNV